MGEIGTVGERGKGPEGGTWKREPPRGDHVPGVRTAFGRRVADVVPQASDFRRRGASKRGAGGCSKDFEGGPRRGTSKRDQ